MVVSIIELVDRLVMAVCENGRFTVVGIHVWSPVFGQLFLAM